MADARNQAGKQAVERYVEPPDLSLEEPERQLLESVLDQTLRIGIDSEAARDIQAYARQTGEDQCTPAVAEGLVRFLLERHPQGFHIPPHYPKAIAESLLEDPVASVRLSRLWQEARRHVR